MVDLPRLDDDPVRGVLVADLEESILDESHDRAAPALSVSISYQKIHMVDNGKERTGSSRRNKEADLQATIEDL